MKRYNWEYWKANRNEKHVTDYRMFFYWRDFIHAKLVAVGDSNWNIYYLQTGFLKGSIISVPKPGKSALNGGACASGYGDIQYFRNTIRQYPHWYKLTPYGKHLLQGGEK